MVSSASSTSWLEAAATAEQIIPASRFLVGAEVIEHDAFGHQFRHPASMRFRIIQCEHAWWRDGLDPPRPMILRSDPFAVRLISLTENAYDAPVAIDDRKSAVVVIDQQLHRFRYQLLWTLPFSLIGGQRPFPTVPLKAAELSKRSGDRWPNITEAL